jgi:hypothetical protein
MTIRKEQVTVQHQSHSAKYGEKLGRKAPSSMQNEQELRKRPLAQETLSSDVRRKLDDRSIEEKKQESDLAIRMLTLFS